MEKQVTTRGRYLTILIGVLVFLGLYLSSRYSYPLFHSLTQLFSIIIFFSLFVVAWNSRRFLPNHYLLFLGIAHLFIGALDIVHILAYKGMVVFPGYDPTNLSSQLWIAAMYVRSLSFLIALLFLRRKLKAGLTFLGYAIVTSLLLTSIFYWEIFPVSFVEGVGLTPFKIISEYIISFILLISLVLLDINRREFDKNVLRLLTFSIATTVVSELALTLYVDAYDASSLVGYFLKILAAYLLYVALVETGLSKPHNLLFHHLKQSEEILTQQAQHLEGKVKEGTAALEAEFIAHECAEEALVRINRLLKVLSLSNQTMIHATDEQKLLWDICQIAVKTGGYPLAWVGYAEDGAEKMVRPVAQAGDRDGYLAEVRITWADTERGRGPCGTAIRTGSLALSRNIALAPNFSPWREGALKRGYASVIALPLTASGRTFGAFNVYAAKPNAFDQEEVDLFMEMAGDLAFGVTALRMRGEQERAEKALAASEARFRTLADNAPVGISVNTLDGRPVARNRAMMEMLGYSSEEEFARVPVIETYYDPEDRKRLVEMVLKGPVRNFEVQRRRKDGSVFWSSITSTLFTTASGERQLIGVTLDITEQKQAEEILKASEERLRTLVENLPVGLSIATRGGADIFRNRALQEMYGYESKEKFIKITSEQHFYDIEDRKRLLETREKEGHAKDFEVRLRRKDGSLFWGSITVVPWISESGESQLIGVTLDITERKQAEETLKASRESLRESESRFRATTIMLEALFNAIPDVIDVQDTSHRILRYNEAGYGFLNVKPEEAIGKRCYEVIGRNKPCEICATAEACKAKIPTMVEKYMEELKTWVEARAYPVLDDSGEVNLVIEHLRDISERKRADEEIKQSYERLGRAFGQTVQTTALISEVRDPYTAGHQRRVAQLSYAIAREMGLPEEQLEGIRMAAFIHDIGKMYVPSEILSKPGKLTEPEFSLIKAHSQVGYDILKTIEFPWPIAQIVLEHHERLDGSGYPAGLRGDKTCLEAKILAVADVVEAMSSHRPYRPALGTAAALEEIEKNKNILYDSEVAGACIRLFTEKLFKFE